MTVVDDPRRRSRRKAPEPIGIGELELCDSSVARTTAVADSHVRWVRTLVRACGVPVGWIWLDRTTPRDGESPAADFGDVACNLARRALRVRLEPSAEQVALPPITVVVCASGEPDALAGCLEAVRQLDYPEFETVLVDSAPAADAVRQLAEEYGIRYVREPMAGMGRARNRGILEAGHEIIAFTGDGARVDRHWLRGLARGFADERVGVVTGIVTSNALETEPQQVYDLSCPGASTGFAPRDVDPASAEAWTLLWAGDPESGANLAARRAVLDHVGGFDAALDAGDPSGGGSAVDFIQRALLAGHVLRYQPAALVWRIPPSTSSELRHRMSGRGRAIGGALLARFREGALPRRLTAGQAARWFAGRLVRIPRRLMRRERMPIPMILAELWGAVRAPLADPGNQRRDRQHR